MKIKKITAFFAAAAAGSILLTGCAGGTDKETETAVQKEAVTEAQTQSSAPEETEAQTQSSAPEETEAQTQGDSGSEQETEAQTAGSTADAGNTDGQTGLFGNFETVTLEGETVTQEIFAEADLNMVNIWGTFCGPCIREMPELGELSDEYADKGVQIMGMLTDVTDPEDETAHLIVDETKADYTHLVLSQDLVDHYLSQVQAVPTTVFVDSEGNQVGEVYTGARSKEDWSAIVDELLGTIS